MPRFRVLVCFVALFAVHFAPRESNAAGVFYVDGNNASCSDLGPGTVATPFCTISAAAGAVGGPGTTINVLPGFYREQVTVPFSGSSGSRFVFHATGPGVTVDGADDFSASGLWTPVVGDVWLAATVNWAPEQVFADGARIDTATVALPNLTPGTYAYVAGTGLYVNVGAGNPGTHNVRVGHRANGFRIVGRSWVTIDGFEVTRTERVGIAIVNASTDCSILNNNVSYANTFGIQAINGARLVIESNRVSLGNDHGISLTNASADPTGVINSLIRGNESFGNARPVGRAANGIILFGSSNNRIERNRLHDNEDTGLQINQNSNDNLSIQNRSWSNGDHGFDHLNSNGNVHIGDVAWGNFMEGFSIEGTSRGTRLSNCIAVDNGLTSQPLSFNLLVEDTTGFVSDYNIFWNSIGTNRIKFGLPIFTTLADYVTASGRDAHSTEADPRFVDPAAGDFHLLAGSPAIDSGTSEDSNWPALDAEGHLREDDPSTPNTGAGPVAFADRGALEFVPPINPPPPPPPGTTNLCRNPSFENNLDGWDPYGGSTIGRVLGGYDGDYALEIHGHATVTNGTNDSPNWVASAPAAGTRYRFGVWVRSDSHNGHVRLRIREYLAGVRRGGSLYSSPVTLSPAWTEVTVDRVASVAGASLDLQIINEGANQVFQVDLVKIEIISPPGSNLPPIAALSINPPSGPAPLGVTADATASSDPGGAIVSYRFDFGDGTIIGPQPEPTAFHSYAAGSWTASVTVTDNDGLTNTATVAVNVTPGSGGGGPCASPSFEPTIEGWDPHGPATIAQIAGGHLGNFALEVRGAASRIEFGVNDGPNCVRSTPAAGTRYRYTAWVRSVAHHGTARIRIREYLAGVRQGVSSSSTRLKLGPDWQQLIVDRVTLQAGTSLDMQVLDEPSEQNEVFQVDDITVSIVGPTPETYGGPEPDPDPASTRDGELSAVRFAAVVTPNPTRGDGSIELTTTRPGRARIRIFDPAGRAVGTPLDERFLPAGHHRIQLRAPGERALPTGLYLYRIEAVEGELGGRFVRID